MNTAVITSANVSARLRTALEPVTVAVTVTMPAVTPDASTTASLLSLLAVRVLRRARAPRSVRAVNRDARARRELDGRANRAVVPRTGSARRSTRSKAFTVGPNLPSRPKSVEPRKAPSPPVIQRPDIFRGSDRASRLAPRKRAWSRLGHV